jgi:hypothetical protein
MWSKPVLHLVLNTGLPRFQETSERDFGVLRPLLYHYRVIFRIPYPVFVYAGSIKTERQTVYTIWGEMTRDLNFLLSLRLDALSG